MFNILRVAKNKVVNFCSSVAGKFVAGTTALVASGSSMAAGVLDATSVGTLQADITSDIAFAAGIGIALMAITLGWDVGISLIKKFTKKGT